MEQQQLVSNNISYSLLKAFDENGPRVLIEKYSVKTKSTDFGTKLDDFISLSTDEFNKNYVIVQNIISGDLLNLAELIAKSNIDITEMDDIKKNLIVGEIISQKLFKTVTKNETRLKKFDNKVFYDFVELIRRNNGKTFISPEEYTKLITCKSSLYSHTSTKKYFNCSENCEEFYQVELNFKYKNKNIKVILDKIIIDHENRTIQGLDLKSGSVNSEEFNYNFFKYKYYIQGALYKMALQEKYWHWEVDPKEPYRILPFKYIFLPTFNYNNPKTFILTDKWVEAAWKGFKTNSGYFQRGIDELIDEISWHIDNQVFNQTRKFYENEEIELDDSFIHLK